MVRLGLVVSLACAFPAYAARPAAVSQAGGLVLTEARVEETLHDAEDLESASRSGRSIISPKVAVSRFEESVYQYMVKDYETAAEGFFILVTTGALVEANLHLDAEWYLAESLQGMENSTTAEAWYHQIADDATNPFRDDAVRRLLEVYAATGRTQEFRDYYDATIARGTVATSDPITYSLAKAFYHQKDLVRAKSSLLEIAPTSPLYRKARYWLGAIAVVEGNLDEALANFDEVATASVTSPEERDIYDLALLAGARIALERHDYDDAAARYAKVGGDSKYLADKLYEETWTFITHKEELRKKLLDPDGKLSDEERSTLQAQETSLRQGAQRGVEIFLLAFPEHPYTPQLKLLAGHLQQHAQDWDGALQTYEQVIAEYRPVRERFELLSQDSAAASRYLDPLLEYQKTGYFETDLPPYALAMLVQDEDIQTAAKMKGTIERQRSNVASSEALIEQINTAINRPEGLELHRRRIAEVEGVSDTTLFLQIDLLGEEQRLLEESVGKARLEPFTKRRLKLQDRAFAGERGDTMEADLTTLIAELAAVRPPDAALRGSLDKISSWHRDLAKHRVQLATVRQGLKDTEGEEVVKVRERVTFESTEVDAQRTDLALTGDQADAVMTGMTREGFGRLANVFGEAAMTADMGIVDVYWATLLESTERRTNLTDERQLRLDLLEDDFTRIRQQLGPVNK